MIIAEAGTKSTDFGESGSYYTDQNDVEVWDVDEMQYKGTGTGEEDGLPVNRLWRLKQTTFNVEYYGTRTAAWNRLKNQGSLVNEHYKPPLRVGNGIFEIRRVTKIEAGAWQDTPIKQTSIPK